MFFFTIATQTTFKNVLSETEVIVRIFLADSLIPSHGNAFNIAT